MRLGVPHARNEVSTCGLQPTTPTGAAKDLYDAADLEPGPHQDTFATELTDGHGRVTRATERAKTNGHIEQRHILTVYNPLGAPEIITRRRGASSDPSGDITRWMRYDTLGRLVVNYDPHVSEGFAGTPNIASLPSAEQFPSGAANAIHTWRYAYNDAGDLVGTSDARGCGTNFDYDALGRLLGEDYSPCETHHSDYSHPDGTLPLIASGNQSWEVIYTYDAPPTASDFVPSSFTSATQSFWVGRLAAVADRAALSLTEYDGRGRVTKTARKIAKPAVPGQTPNNLADRYAQRWYFTATAYDAADRPALTSAGLRSTQLQGGDIGGSPYGTTSSEEPDYNKSTVRSVYSTRGTLASVEGSYGTLLASIIRRADGLVEQVTYGDLTGTITATSYDGRRRPTSIQTYRAAPGTWSSGIQPPTANGGTLQLLLQDLDISYDIVGNPTEIRDWRDPAEWPVGAKPVTRKIAYDDLYRVRQVKYEYSTDDEQWTSPFFKENNETSTNRDHRRSAPSPHVSFDQRVLQQQFEYDWLGNTVATDDDAHGFYDRSLGDIDNDAVHGKPYQLAAASNTAAGGSRTGSLATKYDLAGNLTDLAVTRSGPCLPSGASCNQRYHYGWDEVGRLIRAQRWDTATPVNQEPSGNPIVDLAYTYDASDNRVLKSATAREGTLDVQRHAVYISGGQELRGAQFGTSYGQTGVADYQVDSTTEVAYLFAHGVRLARVAHDAGQGLPIFTADSNPQQHVLINLDDTLGSTALVIDKATGELVESTAYLANGATESDYRPDRWKGLREDYRFTGKEEDVEVGLQYFGKRFLSPYLSRWISADPMTVHAPSKSDWNLYAYVSGAVLKSVDPLGLCEDMDACIQGDFRTSQAPEVRSIGDSNHPPASDQDKVADSLGVPRAKIQNGELTTEALDHARKGLPSALQEDKSLRPVVDREGVQGWTTERGGTYRLHTSTGKEAGYAGEKPLVPTISPVDLLGPAAAKGLWTLGGRALRLGHASGGVAARGEATVGYHATNPEAAGSILSGGFRMGTKPGRLGSGGVYVNDSPAGAIAEFSHHNPGVTPSVLKVEYNPGTNAATTVAPRNYVTSHPLNVDSISAPSLRAPGTVNTNILNGSGRPIGVVE